LFDIHAFCGVGQRKSAQFQVSDIVLPSVDKLDIIISLQDCNIQVHVLHSGIVMVKSFVIRNANI